MVPLRAGPLVGGLLLLLASCFPVQPARAAGAATGDVPEEQAPFGPAWSRLPGREGWILLVSPPFPAAWPPGRAPLVLIRYAFAARLSPGIADGAIMARPWARSLQAPDGRVTVEQLLPGLEPAGVQGVRPLRTEELALLNQEAPAAALLRQGGPAARSDLVRTVTCAWIARQGTVAALIVPRHRAFNRWLSCRP